MSDSDSTSIFEIVRSAVVGHLASEKGQGLIRGHVEKLVEASVADAFRFGETGEAIDKAVKEALAVPESGGKLCLASYGHTILKVLEVQVANLANESIQKQVVGRTKNLLEPPPAEITLSKLVEEFIEQVKHDTDDHEGEITLHVRGSDTSGFWHIELDSEANTSRGRCEIDIGVYRDEIYHLRFKDEDVEKMMFVGPLFGFERSVFQMRAGKTKIIRDEDNVGTSWWRN
jgi:hypothetical protein